MLELTIDLLQQFKVEGEHISQMTGGLTNYLAVEIARKKFRPDESLSFMQFLTYDSNVREIADWMGAASPGFEVAPVFWKPQCSWRRGKKRFEPFYGEKELRKTWEEIEKGLD